MTTEQKYKFTYDVLGVFDCREIWESLLWTTRDGNIHFYVSCDEYFQFDIDSEEITPENFHLLEPALEDCEAISDNPRHRQMGLLLFVARSRKMSPNLRFFMEEMPNKRLCQLFKDI